MFARLRVRVCQCREDSGSLLEVNDGTGTDAAASSDAAKAEASRLAAIVRNKGAHGERVLVPTLPLSGILRLIHGLDCYFLKARPLTLGWGRMQLCSCDCAAALTIHPLMSVTPAASFLGEMCLSAFCLNAG